MLITELGGHQPIRAILPCSFIVVGDHCLVARAYRSVCRICLYSGTQTVLPCCIRRFINRVT